jgi:cob(I)alamin adenosyltransferase
VTEDEIVAEIQDSLMFPGDTGAGPDAEMIASVEFANCLDELLAELRKYAKAANKIERFWLKTGHPAYPVFWDFALLFSSADASLVIIGSASD